MIVENFKKMIDCSLITKIELISGFTNYIFDADGLKSTQQRLAYHSTMARYVDTLTFQRFELGFRVQN